jgi:hypothetical protein
MGYSADIGVLKSWLQAEPDCCPSLHGANLHTRLKVVVVSNKGPGMDDSF